MSNNDGYHGYEYNQRWALTVNAQVEVAECDSTIIARYTCYNATAAVVSSKTNPADTVMTAKKKV